MECADDIQLIYFKYIYYQRIILIGDSEMISFIDWFTDFNSHFCYCVQKGNSCSSYLYVPGGGTKQKPNRKGSTLKDVIKRLISLTETDEDPGRGK